MTAHFVRTDTIYRDIINAPDAETRQQSYISQLIEPWQNMMQMVAGADNDNPLAGAEQWHWLLPSQLMDTPQILTDLETMDAWTIGAQALEKGMGTLSALGEKMPFDSVEGWLILADAERADPIMRGYTGGIDFMRLRLLCQYDTLTPANARALPGCVVHELNHLVRLRLFPWDMQATSVADYIIHEGIAESFAGALFGDDVLGHYVTDFDEAQIDHAREQVGKALDTTGFGIIRSYIFGDTWAKKLGLPLVGMPDYGGYAIGYRVVQAYLERTGCSIVEATGTPAKTIIAESGYF
ncbi:MAG: DUF2268 domain-containing putative Zn-dependent protease [Chloroflexota bacterium]